VDFVHPARPVSLQLVGGRGHYERVVKAVMEATRSVWIATANLKELMVEDGRAAPGRRRTMARGRAGAGAYRSVLAVWADLVQRGVEIRILHAGIPSGPFRAELARQPALRRLQLHQCPRVHFKAVIVDGAEVYLGSANWTGAGLGAKGEGRRNFELGLVTRDDQILDQVQGLYDHVFRGKACGTCKLREVCPKPIDGGSSSRAAEL
jgi:phosphatidylserine/phosphatidylglycerophosphate/cardiolipin synthase-like enzyme